jgi:hypothetical protein
VGGIDNPLEPQAVGLEWRTKRRHVQSRAFRMADEYMTTRPQNWEAVKALFEAALEKEPAQLVRGLNQCTRTQYESNNAALYVVNNCNVPVYVGMPSHNGNVSGGTTEQQSAQTAELWFQPLEWDITHEGTEPYGC